MHQFSDDLFKQLPIVGILRGYDKWTTLKIVTIYEQVGFRNIEITMNTPDVLSIIWSIVEQFAGRLNIGVGTVLTKTQVDTVLSVGGQFIVSPIMDEGLISYCKTKALPIFPGAYSPTEIFQAWMAGAKMVKVFPARNLGPSYIKDILAPLNDLALMPTGGVNEDNLPEYVDAGAQAFGMGGLLFDKQLIERQDWAGLEKRLVAVREIWEKTQRS
ncbi:MAG: bifunctional 4-hydroxy-2-oxoglutarate aldolase/2-dehydro-3-deoxy-phosphogluconate aldolase [Bacteroidota bacterium]